MFRKIIDLIPPLKKGLKYIIATALVIELLKLVPNLIFKELIDTLVEFTKSDINYIILLVALSFATSIVVSIIEKFTNEYNIMAIIKSEVSLIKAAQNKMMELSLDYHEKKNTGQEVTRLTKGIHHLTVLLFHSIFDFLPVIFQVLYSTIIIFVVSWKIGLVFIFFMPLFIFYTHKIAVKLQPLRKTYHEFFEEASGKLSEMVINVKTVKDFTWEDMEKHMFDYYMNNYYNRVQERINFEEYHSMLRDILMQLGRVVTLAFSVFLVYTGEITAGSLVLIVTLNEKASASVYRIGRTYNYVGDSISGVRRIVDLMSKNPSIKEKKNAKTAPKLKGKIDFENVNFSYVRGQRVLHNIDFKVQPKKTVALVGTSGCGKSTLIKLLYRHFDVESGRILLDDFNIKDLKIDSFRNQLAIVSQDVELFNASIMENITYGTKNYTKDEVINASKMAYAHDFIKELKDGYDTIVGEKGVKLSGGQKQRIGIARALLRKPSILIFDEATSSLDTESEKKIQKAMQKLFNKQTMIIIAHRLSTIEHADKIIVLEDGQIVEQGSPKTLMNKKGGLFKKMRALQNLGELR
ncbi:MAG: ABC transporter ATP-binding protein [Nanoarchaeota archaeon]